MALERARDPAKRPSLLFMAPAGKGRVDQVVPAFVGAFLESPQPRRERKRAVAKLGVRE
jgi:hypothetical protein